jgi:hypothetical protein
VALLTEALAPEGQWVSFARSRELVAHGLAVAAVRALAVARVMAITRQRKGCCTQDQRLG